jgi:hypothetical protein
MRRSGRRLPDRRIIFCRLDANIGPPLSRDPATTEQAVPKVAAAQMATLDSERGG